MMWRFLTFVDSTIRFTNGTDDTRSKSCQLCSWVTSNGGCADAMPSRVGRLRVALAVRCAGDNASKGSARYIGYCSFSLYPTDRLFLLRRASAARAWKSSPLAAWTNSLAAVTFFGGVNFPVSH